MHDEVATDKRKPTLNANGKVYGVDIANDKLTVGRLREHKTGERNRLPILAPGAPSFFRAESRSSPRRTTGNDVIWTNPANPHNPMMDQLGRVWMTSQIRGVENPTYCQSGVEQRVREELPDGAQHAAGGGLRSRRPTR